MDLLTAVRETDFRREYDSYDEDENFSDEIIEHPSKDRWRPVLLILFKKADRKIYVGCILQNGF